MGQTEAGSGHGFPQDGRMDMTTGHSHRFAAESHYPMWEAVFVLFKGYIDESYDGSARNLFALSCLIADSKDSERASSRGQDGHFFLSRLSLHPGALPTSNSSPCANAGAPPLAG
jgi:hypothetical protein